MMRGGVIRGGDGGLLSLTLSDFKGVDLTNAPAGVALGRSPEAPNMLRDVPGKVRKRMGYTTLAHYSGRINGRHALAQGDTVRELIHAGDKLYFEGQPVWEDMADGRSVSRQFGGKLYIFDGKQALCYGEADGQWAVQPLTQAATVPLVAISRHPDGGGTDYQPVNLLSRGWQESFLCTAEDTVYQLLFDGLATDPVKCEKLAADGSWQTLTEGTDFSVDRAAGRLTFVSAPGESPISGQDNLKVTAFREWAGYAGRIDGCRVLETYGVNAAADRLFVTGNGDYPNYDWYSEYNDPTFFGDTRYSVLGQDDAAVVGYSIVGDLLAAHKASSENGRNVILRRGEMADGQAAFPAVGALQGEGAISPYSFCYLGTEPLFLTGAGVYAITPKDVTGERYTQSRSFFLDGALTKEPGLADAFATRYRDFYLLCCGENLYLLDGLVRDYDRARPESAWQYEGYLFPGLNARVLWEGADGALYFGRADGAVCRFATDVQAPESYFDDGQPIEAYWDMADFSGREFFRNKTIRFIAVQLAAAADTGVTVKSQVRGAWRTLWDSAGRARYFSWGDLRWSQLSWTGDATPRTLGKKIRIKKVDKTRFRLQNSAGGQPFGLYQVGLEYREKGRYKR
ncbi:Uncharacterised protein [uncultured Clostridium sp.]|nr:Uncharacterised protein [uncultured Clostridium sp.]